MFQNINRVEYTAVNLDVLQGISESKGISELNLETFRASGLSSKNDLIKVLGRGEVKTALKVTAHKFSDTAKNAIEAAGGSVVII